MHNNTLDTRSLKTMRGFYWVEKRVVHVIAYCTVILPTRTAQEILRLECLRLYNFVDVLISRALLDVEYIRYVECR